MSNESKNTIVLNLDIGETGRGELFGVSSALTKANLELQTVEEQLAENLETIQKLTPQCDKTDYVLAATSGAICGIIDIFLVGKPGESPLGDITDKWFENRTKDFARLCGWNGKGTANSAIRFLEGQFKVPYDQTGLGDAGKEVFGLNAKNHHFKSLAHNPTLLGLFFSILDQFTNTSHFVTGGRLIVRQNNSTFELRGNSITSKLFCGFVNWLGHLMSDVAGVSQTDTPELRKRGMGIPSPMWCWINDVIAIKETLHMPVFEFEKSICELAEKIYLQGYDIRFQTTQAIPVFINEMLVRLIYSIRRLMRYYLKTEKEERSFSLMWKSCEPFSNATVKRMLTVAHGTFCLVDAGDAVARSIVPKGGMEVTEFFMRLNVVGVGRFAFALYGEVNLVMERSEVNRTVRLLKNEKMILVDYINGLESLASIYDDRTLLDFVEDLKHTDMYKQAFQKTVKLAEKRGVDREKILRSKMDIDNYFGGKRI